MAADLAISTRTLQRRLRDSGTSFRQIQEETTLKEASNLLKDTEISIKEIADKLGYTETSSFSRAIKNASGLSPIELRKSVHSNI